MTGPYTYVDPDGDRLEVVESDTGGIRLVASDHVEKHRTCIDVRPWQVMGLARAMFDRAAGVSPIVLDRPEVVGTGRVACRDGLVEAVDGLIAFLPPSGQPILIEDAPGLAAALAAVHEHATQQAAGDEWVRVAGKAGAE